MCSIMRTVAMCLTIAVCASSCDDKTCPEPQDAALVCPSMDAGTCMCETPDAGQCVPPSDDPVTAHAGALVEEGRQTFRFDTFGDEAFWGGALRLPEAIAGDA